MKTIMLKKEKRKEGEGKVTEGEDKKNRRKGKEGYKSKMLYLQGYI